MIHYSVNINSIVTTSTEHRQFILSIYFMKYVFSNFSITKSIKRNTFQYTNYATTKRNKKSKNKEFNNIYDFCVFLA